MKTENTLQLIFTSKDSSDLQSLFDDLVDSSAKLATSDVTFLGKQRPSSVTGSGIPEVSELVISLGSAGAFVMISTILTTYFRQRPKGKIWVKVTNKQKTLQITAEDADSGKIAELLKSFSK
jgi:hypothetical protein